MKKYWNFNHEGAEGAKGIEYIIFPCFSPSFFAFAVFYNSNVLAVTMC
jgi:hypothetical protein